MQVEKAGVNDYVVIILEHYIFLILTARSRANAGRSGFAGFFVKHGVNLLEEST